MDECAVLSKCPSYNCLFESYNYLLILYCINAFFVSIAKLRLRNFQGSQVSSSDFSTLYISLSHDLIRAKVLSLVNWCFNRESKSYLCISLKAGFFSNKKYDPLRCWSCAELCEAFTFLMENIYVQFDGMVYQQIVGIPIGTNCAPLIADLFLYCYERDFMSDLQKSKSHDLIDMFNDTSRYLDDIFTIDNPEFEKYSGYQSTELQLHKAHTSDKEHREDYRSCAWPFYSIVRTFPKALHSD